jgi:hypothetical protein
MRDAQLYDAIEHARDGAYGIMNLTREIGCDITNCATTPCINTNKLTMPFCDTQQELRLTPLRLEHKWALNPFSPFRFSR